MGGVVGAVAGRHVDDGVQEERRQGGADQLHHDVAGNPPPREVAAQGEGEADGRVQMRARHLAHEQDDGHDHQSRRHHGGLAADHARKGVAHHAATGGHQDEEERAEQLGEQAPPLLMWIVEVVDTVDNSLLVAGQHAFGREILRGCHGHLTLG